MGSEHSFLPTSPFLVKKLVCSVLKGMLFSFAIYPFSDNKSAHLFTFTDKLLIGRKSERSSFLSISKGLFQFHSLFGLYYNIAFLSLSFFSYWRQFGVTV